MVDHVFDDKLLRTAGLTFGISTGSGHLSSRGLESLLETALLAHVLFIIPNMWYLSHVVLRSKKLCDGSTDPGLEPTCGRPLGLGFNYRTGDLYIADAYHG
ncbi:hypothetical protein CK203_075990 [Vitis vinifera]|uniref:Uncharacterized protein n=1 Tax=Vitis vinifera TaxID=29760 RepID=A0A438C2J3_VITVI|nr:hypothetical protein CK203_075990 [Vitis vinifera]